MSGSVSASAACCGASPHEPWCASPAAYAERTGRETTFCVTNGHETVRDPLDSSPCEQCGARILGQPVPVELDVRSTACFACGQLRESRAAGCPVCRMSGPEVLALNSSWLNRCLGYGLLDPNRFGA